MLARPGGNSTIGSIIGDPSARFDDGRQRNPAPAPAQQQQLQQQQQPQQYRSQQQRDSLAQQHATAVSDRAANRATNMTSNIFNFDAAPAGGERHSRRGSIGRGNQWQSDILNQQPAPSQPAPRQSAGAARQSESHIFSSPVRASQPAPSHGAPAQSAQPQPAPTQAAPAHTSVRVRAPPGGHSSITLG